MIEEAIAHLKIDQIIVFVYGVEVVVHENGVDDSSRAGVEEQSSSTGNGGIVHDRTVYNVHTSLKLEVKRSTVHGRRVVAGECAVHKLRPRTFVAFCSPALLLRGIVVKCTALDGQG